MDSVAWRFIKAIAIGGMALGFVALSVILLIYALAGGSDWGLRLTIVLSFLLGLGPIAGGGLLFRYADRRLGKLNNAYFQSRLVNLASRSGGRLTALQVASYFRMEIEEAEAKLHALQNKGYLDAEVSPEGTLVFCLSNYIGPETSHQNKHNQAL